jgi:hypothetical protein
MALGKAPFWTLAALGKGFAECKATFAERQTPLALGKARVYIYDKPTVGHCTMNLVIHIHVTIKKRLLMT